MWRQSLLSLKMFTGKERQLNKAVSMQAMKAERVYKGYESIKTTLCQPRLPGKAS